MTDLSKITDLEKLAKVFRPEILGRIDRIYVFKPLARSVIGEIATLMMVNLAKQYDLELVHVDVSLTFDAVCHARVRHSRQAHLLRNGVCAAES